MALFLTVLHVVVCIVIIVVVLLQRGKGAEVGAVFGGGGSATVFGSRGAGNFLTKITTGSAIVFMLTSLSLAYFAREDARSTLFEDEGVTTEETSPFQEVAPGAEADPEAAQDVFEEIPQAVEDAFEEVPQAVDDALQEIAPTEDGVAPDAPVPDEGAP